jgi:MFS family permease
MSSVCPITEKERNSGLRYGIWDAAFISVTSQIVMGVFLTGLALLLGANAFQIGLLAALPSVTNLAQPFGAYFVERWGSRKLMGLILFTLSRLTWLLVVLFPAFGYTQGECAWALWALISITAVSSLVMAVAGVSWWSWMSDLIPETIRGRYFAQRTVVSAVVGIAVSIACGAFIDKWKLWFGLQDAGGFFVLVVIAVIAGMLSVRALELIPDVPLRRGEETPRWGEAVRDALADRNFRMVTVAGSVWGFAAMFSGPFYVVYMLQSLHLSYGMVNIFNAIACLSNVLYVGLVGRISDHFGNRPVQLACMVGAGVIPFMYLFTAAGNWGIIPLAQLLGGITWAGYTLANMNQVMKITPEENKSVYLGMYNAATGLAYALGPIAGGVLADALHGWHWHAGSATFTNLHIIMVLSGIGRLWSIQLMRRVREPKARTVKRMLKVLWRAPGMNPLVGVQSTWEMVVQGASSVGKRLGVSDNVVVGLRRGRLRRKARRRAA